MLGEGRACHRGRAEGQRTACRRQVSLSASTKWFPGNTRLPGLAENTFTTESSRSSSRVVLFCFLNASGPCKQKQGGWRLEVGGGGGWGGRKMDFENTGYLGNFVGSLGIPGRYGSFHSRLLPWSKYWKKKKRSSESYRLFLVSWCTQKLGLPCTSALSICNSIICRKKKKAMCTPYFKNMLRGPQSSSAAEILP